MSGIGKFLHNLKKLPKNIAGATIRHGAPTSERTKSQAIFSNFFLHIHSTRVHKNSLRSMYSMGLGVACLSLFAILVVTGIFLMIYYKPSVDMAYNSIKDIHYAVPFGRFMRNVHRWAAHLMVACVILHMARVFYTGSYKSPREFNWGVGVGLLVLTLALSFTGYLLPWDQLGYWAAKIGSNIAASPREFTDSIGITPYFDIGGLQRELLLGGHGVGQEALIRFNLLHVIVLPFFITVLIGLHLWRIRKDGGLSRPQESTEEKGSDPKDVPSKSYGLMCVVKGKSPHAGTIPENTVSSWPYLLKAEMLVFMLTLFACCLLGLLFDAPLKEMANANVPENPAKAPWYFLGLQEMVSYSALMGGIIIPALAVFGLLLAPFLDRERKNVGIWFDSDVGKKYALLSLLISIVLACVSVAIPVNYGWLRNWYPEINQLVIILINPGSVLIAFYLLWASFVLWKSGSTRMAAIALFTCCLVGFVILTYVGTELRGPNWGFYWSESDWPVH